jgi:rubredoxin
MFPGGMAFLGAISRIIGFRLRCGDGTMAIPNRTPPSMNEPVTTATATTTAYRTWMCVVCGFIYDEAAGLPEEGIAPGTRWDDIPDTWTCPDCGVTKDDFEMMQL